MLVEFNRKVSFKAFLRNIGIVRHVMVTLILKKHPIDRTYNRIGQSHQSDNPLACVNLMAIMMTIRMCMLNLITYLPGLLKDSGGRNR